MVKTPRTRHSRTGKEPVTIDLSPEEVSRVGAEGSAAADASKPDTQPEPAIVEATGAAQAEESSKNDRPGDNSPFGRQGPAPSAGETSKPEAAKDTVREKATGPAPASAVPPRASRGGGLFAGLVGGVAALAIAAGLQFAGLLSGAVPQNAPVATDHGPAIAALEAEIAALKSEIVAIGSAGNGGEALDARVAGIEERVASLATGLETLRGEVAEIAARPGGEATGPAVDLSPVEGRLAALETALGEMRDAMVPAAALTALEEAMAALRSEIAAGRDSATDAISRLDVLESSLATLAGRVDEQAKAPATAIIIAASSLKAAIDRGTPFATELDTYAALAPEAPQLAELRALAAAGVPTRTQLAAESDAAANAMIAAARPVDPQAGIVDRLMGSMMGLVQVRPIGIVEGEGVPEIAARLDAAVRSGDYERALAEYETLPAEAKAAGQAFIERLRARHTADRLVDEALAAALKA
jgi:hypothetical protein